MLLSFITFINAKTCGYELNSNLKNKSESALCHFMKSYLNKQGQALEITFSGKTKSYYSQTCFNNIYIKNLSECEIEFLSSCYREKYSDAYKIKKSVLQGLSLY